jgi:hypothetical protein
MNRVRTTILLASSLGLLAVVTYWSRVPAGFATPAECVEAYSEASRSGNVAKFLNCLGEPLRSEAEGRRAQSKDLAETLRRSAQDVKSWVQCLEPVVEGSTVRVDVDEVRTAGTRRIRFHLQRTGRGWLINRIDPPRDMPVTIPYGTHIRDVAEEPPTKAQP